MLSHTDQINVDPQMSNVDPSTETELALITHRHRTLTANHNIIISTNQHSLYLAYNDAQAKFKDFAVL